MRKQSMIAKKITVKRNKGFKMNKTIQIIVLLLIINTAASADCLYAGEIYTEGAIRGPYICINGSWIRR